MSKKRELRVGDPVHFNRYPNTGIVTELPDRFGYLKVLCVDGKVRTIFEGELRDREAPDA